MGSTNKTQNFKLNLWEPSDSPLRVDFNGDNELIDSALKTIKDQAAAAQSAASAAFPKAGGEISGKLTLPASTTTAASLNIPHGTAPSAPVNGDVWSTTATVQARINGTTRTLYHNGNAATAALSTVSQTVAETGTATTVYAWTPQRVAQAAAKQASNGIVNGIYSGDGSTERMISLGFTPKFVLTMRGGSTACTNAGTYGGMATTGYGAGTASGAIPTKQSSAQLFIVDGGFILSGPLNGYPFYYSYVAFR